MSHLRTILTAASTLLAIALLGVAALSYVGRGLGKFSLPDDTSLEVRHGLVKVRHITEVLPAIPAAQWPGNPIPPQRLTPSWPWFPWISYSSGHQLGQVSWDRTTVNPANYWVLWCPIWLPLALLALPVAIRLTRRRAEFGSQQRVTLCPALAVRPDAARRPAALFQH